jgi:hypothetical protein
MPLVGLQGKPFVDLEPYVDLDALSSLDLEICLGLARVPTFVTGGSHKSMGIVPPHLADDPYADYGQAISAMSRDERILFFSLSETPHLFDPDESDGYTFGEERDYPLSNKQVRYLAFRYGVYFPWSTYLELMPGGLWDQQSHPEGKAFTKDALVYFPRTVAFVRALPFVSIGSVKVLGLSACQHGTIHRDRSPDDGERGADNDTFMMLSPTGKKRLFLWDDAEKAAHTIEKRAYWFNDADYHGVHADPFFRYSIRVDGTFSPELRRSLSLPEA